MLPTAAPGRRPLRGRLPQERAGAEAGPAARGRRHRGLGQQRGLSLLRDAGLLLLAALVLVLVVLALRTPASPGMSSPGMSSAPQSPAASRPGSAGG